jgi:hypothetical protein
VTETALGFAMQALGNGTLAPGIAAWVDAPLGARPAAGCRPPLQRPHLTNLRSGMIISITESNFMTDITIRQPVVEFRAILLHTTLCLQAFDR